VPSTSSSAELHVLYRIANESVREFPYPHVYVRDVFPPDFYRELRAKLPPPEALATLSSMGRVKGDAAADQRTVLPLTTQGLAPLDEGRRAFWQEIAGWLLGGSFGQVMTTKFSPWLQRRFPNLATARFVDEALLVQDRRNYSLGPHTDHPSKVLSFLFYLPADDSQPHLGTSIYLPKDPGFGCPGGPHHPFDKFDRLFTMPYVPNAMFAFMKTQNAFHGVEPVEGEAVRELLLYDIRAQRA
jgi:hypothetical protein